jgi:hypothetical protein
VSTSAESYCDAVEGIPSGTTATFRVHPVGGRPHDLSVQMR